MRRLKSLLIALVVLALSAGVAFAARVMPQAANGGLERAAEAAGKTVPVDHTAGDESDEEEQAPDAEEETTEETEETTEEETTEDAQAETHGATVSEAAEGDTPEGWANHGAYVSAVARGLAEPGDPAPAEAVENGGRMPNPGTEAAAAAKAKAGGAAAAAQGRGSGRP